MIVILLPARIRVRFADMTLNKMMYIRSVYLSVLIFLLSPNAYSNSLLTAIPPTVEISEIEIIDWVENNLNLNATFAVDNKNSFDVNIKAIRYDMTVIGTSIAKDYWSQDVVLKANTNNSVTMPVAVNMLNVFSIMPEVLLQSQIQYALTGAVAVKDFPLHIPFEHKGVLTLAQ